MTWKIEVSETARRQLKKLDRESALSVARFLRDRLSAVEDPRSLGKALSGPLGGLWRYRVGHLRVICQIHKRDIEILVIRIADRKDVYR